MGTDRGELSRQRTYLYCILNKVRTKKHWNLLCHCLGSGDGGWCSKCCLLEDINLTICTEIMPFVHRIVMYNNDVDLMSFWDIHCNFDVNLRSLLWVLKQLSCGLVWAISVILILHSSVLVMGQPIFLTCFYLQLCQILVDLAIRSHGLTVENIFIREIHAAILEVQHQNCNIYI